MPKERGRERVHAAGVSEKMKRMIGTKDTNKNREKEACDTDVWPEREMRRRTGGRRGGETAAGAENTHTAEV